MNKNILLLTTMYPDPFRPATKVCHYFALEWKKMGYNVLVINYRSMFPRIYTDLAALFPWLAKKYIGNHVEMDRNQNVVEHDVDGIHVYSIPIFKYFPHGRYSKKVLNEKVDEICGIINARGYNPDAIIGHFYNPQLPIIAKLKDIYPNAKTCVSLHEWDVGVIKNTYPNNYDEMLHKIDIIGYRSVPIKKSFEQLYGNDFQSLLCFSGTPSVFVETPVQKPKVFTDAPLRHFIFVGQFIKRKYPKLVMQAVNELYGNDNYHIIYVGKKYMCYNELESYVKTNSMETRVEFTGQIDREKIIDHYDESDCFIMISEKEVFGLVYLEAMSRGCITIASRNEGVDGIIIDGENGFLCEAGNLLELKSIINKINSLPAKEKNRISENAINTARKFSDYKVAKAYIEKVMNA